MADLIRKIPDRLHRKSGNTLIKLSYKGVWKAFSPKSDPEF